MNRRSVLALAALALPLAGCGDETVTRRIRVIAKAEVAGKPVEGSTVMEITWRGTSDGRMFIENHGEALILELDGHGTAFILPTSLDNERRLTPNYWAYVLLRSIGIEGQGQREDFPKLESAQGRYPVTGIGNTPRLPLIVRFANENRKDSVRQVLPENFESAFGSGAKFVGIEFEFTDDPPTEILAERLPMLAKRDPNNVFPRDEPGKTRATSNLPIEYKLTEQHFIIR